MSKLDQRIGDKIVERVKLLTPHTNQRTLIKRKLLTLPVEDRDVYLQYLEEKGSGDE